MSYITSTAMNAEGRPRRERMAIEQICAAFSRAHPDPTVPMSAALVEHRGPDWFRELVEEALRRERLSEIGVGIIWTRARLLGFLRANCGICAILTPNANQSPRLPRDGFTIHTALMGQASGCWCVMNWTRSKPKEPGYYWLQFDGVESMVVKVDPSVLSDGYDVLDHTGFEWEVRFHMDHTPRGALWAGPVPSP